MDWPVSLSNLRMALKQIGYRLAGQARTFTRLHNYLHLKYKTGIDRPTFFGHSNTIQVKDYTQASEYKL